MNIPGIFTIPLHAQKYLFCLYAQFLKPSSPIYIYIYIYIYKKKSRAGVVEGRAKLTKKSTLQKEVLTETMKKNIT